MHALQGERGTGGNMQNYLRWGVTVVVVSAYAFR